MSQSFYSNGKLLITGEYAVLDGAVSLALPTKYGQSLEIKNRDDGVLRWTSYENGTVWYQQIFDLGSLDPFEELTSNDEQLNIGKKLQSILQAARELNEKFLSPGQGYEVATRINFNREWGLGTSSTLINNLASWAQIDPYKLLDKTFGGSGYDIACASSAAPILYQRTDGAADVKTVEFNPTFAEHIHFVYLNKKQDSRMGIRTYRDRDFDRQALIAEISQLSYAFINCKELSEFLELIQQHESLISIALKLPKVQDQLFSDYDGAVKSLGAWGGDFVMSVSRNIGPEYFKEKGYHTVIPFSQMVL